MIPKRKTTPRIPRKNNHKTPKRKTPPREKNNQKTHKTMMVKMIKTKKIKEQVILIL